MKITQMGQDICLEEITDFSLSQTLDCGQCFTFSPAEPLGEDIEAYEGVAFGKYLYISQGSSTITLRATSREDFDKIWCDYFDLNCDYGEIKTILSQDEILKKAATYAPGIRVLRQDSWEALCCFILSQNNNVKRIHGIVERFCQTFGRELQNGVHAFPTAAEMAGVTEDQLAPLRSGFRAKYLVDAIRLVNSNELNWEAIPSLPIEEARAELMKIKGVGPKVADCTLLFGFHRLECCPMDVWMKRVMSELFPQGLPPCALPYVGIAQQYLFHYARIGGGV